MRDDYQTKNQGWLYGIHSPMHPFDVERWDGCCYSQSWVE